MSETIKQLETLLIGSVPTMIFFVTLVIAYGVLVRGPLDKVLAERRARTSGAIEQARGAMGAAEAETAVFEDKLRSAKGELFQAREQKMKVMNAEREQALEQARATTQGRVREARQEIEQSMAEARQQIESMSGELSAQIMKAVLPKGVSATEVAQ